MPWLRNMVEQAEPASFADRSATDGAVAVARPGPQHSHMGRSSLSAAPGAARVAPFHESTDTAEPKFGIVDDLPWPIPVTTDELDALERYLAIEPALDLLNQSGAARRTPRANR